MTTFALTYDNTVYRLKPAMRTVCMIEEELGPIPTLCAHLQQDKWRVSDLVTLVHILLDSAGKPVDYMTLGDRILADGTQRYREAVLQFLITLCQA